MDFAKRSLSANFLKTFANDAARTSSFGDFDGELRTQIDTNHIWQWDAATNAWTEPKQSFASLENADGSDIYSAGAFTFKNNSGTTILSGTNAGAWTFGVAADAVSTFTGRSGIYTNGTGRAFSFSAGTSNSVIGFDSAGQLQIYSGTAANIRSGTFDTLVAWATAGGDWTFGPSGYTGTHNFNGNVSVSAGEWTEVQATSKFRFVPNPGATDYLTIMTGASAATEALRLTANGSLTVGTNNASSFHIIQGDVTPILYIKRTSAAGAYINFLTNTSSSRGWVGFANSGTFEVVNGAGSATNLSVTDSGSFSVGRIGQNNVHTFECGAMNGLPTYGFIIQSHVSPDPSGVSGSVRLGWSTTNLRGELGGYRNATGGGGFAFLNYSTVVGSWNADGAWTFGSSTAATFEHNFYGSINIRKGNAGASTVLRYYDNVNQLCGYVNISADTDTTTYVNSSDGRRKTDHQDFSGLDLLARINPTSYKIVGTDVREIGIVAQELYEIFPEAVGVGGEDVNTEPWGIDYGRLTPLIIKAVKEQQLQIEQLKLEINTLKGGN